MSDEALVVITGAGASHGCLSAPSGTDPLIDPPPDGLLQLRLSGVLPPLTQGLVDRTRRLTNFFVNQYPACRPVVDFLRSELERREGEPTLALEQALAKYQARGEHDPTVERHLTAFRFYLRDLLWACTDYMQSDSLAGGVTYYTRLVTEVHRWARQTGNHVCLVNFNYDLLLEEACSNVWGFDLHKLDDYIGEPVSLLKPHGSVNWSWAIKEAGKAAPAFVAQKAISLIQEGGSLHDALYVQRWPSYRYRGTSHAAVRIPALALPIEEKSEFVWPDGQRDHLLSLEGKVTRLLVVGYRAMEPTMNELLRAAATDDCKVGIVTGGAEPVALRDFRDVRDRLDIGRSGPRSFLKGFGDMLESNGLDWLLG